MVDKYVLETLLKKVPKKRKFIIRKESSDEYLIKAEGMSNIIVLNELSYRVLQEIEGKKSILEISETIFTEYEGIDLREMQEDVCFLCRDLERMGVILM